MLSSFSFSHMMKPMLKALMKGMTTATATVTIARLLKRKFALHHIFPAM